MDSAKSCTEISRCRHWTPFPIDIRPKPHDAIFRRTSIEFMYGDLTSFRAVTPRWRVPILLDTLILGQLPDQKWGAYRGANTRHNKSINRAHNKIILDFYYVDITEVEEDGDGTTKLSGNGATGRSRTSKAAHEGRS